VSLVAISKRGNVCPHHLSPFLGFWLFKCSCPWIFAMQDLPILEVNTRLGGWGGVAAID